MQMIDVRSESSRFPPLKRYKNTPFYTHIARWTLSGGSKVSADVHDQSGNMDAMLKALNEGWLDAAIDPAAEGVMVDIEMNAKTRFKFPSADWMDGLPPMRATSGLVRNTRPIEFDAMLSSKEVTWWNYVREKAWYLYLFRAYAQRWGSQDFADQIGAAKPLKIGTWNMWATPNMVHYRPDKAKNAFHWLMMEMQTRLFTGGGEMFDEVGLSPRFFGTYVDTTEYLFKGIEAWKEEFDFKLRMVSATSAEAVPVVWPYMLVKSHADPENPKKIIPSDQVRDEQRKAAMARGIPEDLLPAPSSGHIPLPGDWMEAILAHIESRGVKRCAFWSSHRDPWTSNLPAVKVLESFIARGAPTPRSSQGKPLENWSMTWNGAASTGSFTFDYRDGSSGKTGDLQARDFELLRSVLVQNTTVYADHVSATASAAHAPIMKMAS